ncbi:MAG: hypothetical protein AAF383_19315 [Cyanobacteria bacterium P01_A01_bin.83]
MNAGSRYWKIYRISLSRERVGYEYSLVPSAQGFFRQTISKVLTINGEDIQTTLSNYFHNQAKFDLNHRADAGLCLRCYVSHPILKACQKIASLFASNKSFSYQDLLPFVLNDDGQTQIILDRDGKNQLILKQDGTTKTSTFEFFTVKVLQTYSYDAQTKMSLDNWAYLQTKQNSELRKFLSEFGFKALSDWALLNRARPKKIERLSQRDRYIVEAFHAIYRRDRRQQKQRGIKRCPQPNETQLQAMLTYLAANGVVIDSGAKLLRALKQVAIQLRDYDIWSSREPLEVQQPETGSYVLRSDLPHDSISETDIERQELRQFLHQQFQLALTKAIEQEIQATIAKLRKSKRYSPFASLFIPGLQIYYVQGKSLKEIFPQLGMTSWDQARRVLNPGELLSRVRTVCVQQLLEQILQLVEQKGLTQIPPQPEYLKALAEQIEAFADAEVFQGAVAEIKTGKNRSFNSLYSQRLRSCLEQQSSYMKYKKE